MPLLLISRNHQNYICIRPSWPTVVTSRNVFVLCFPCGARDFQFEKAQFDLF